jgi:hypothetical protein
LLLFAGLLYHPNKPKSMTFVTIAQYISDGLAVALIVRLLMLRLHTVYRVFCAFLVVDLVGSIAFLFEKFVQPYRDYRITWMALRPLRWVLVLWMVYALLDAILANLPGILRISRRVLNIAFVGALIVALSTAGSEYSASRLSSAQNPVGRALGVGLVLDRVISMAAVLVLLAILGFVLWFPVQMPRNLAVFSIGFVAYFAIRTGVLLTRTYLPDADPFLLSDISAFVLAACYAFWLLFINHAGELRPVRMGHSWEPGQQQRMIAELEAMNAALVRPSRR